MCLPLEYRGVGCQNVCSGRSLVIKVVVTRVFGSLLGYQGGGDTCIRVVAWLSRWRRHVYSGRSLVIKEAATRVFGSYAG